MGNWKYSKIFAPTLKIERNWVQNLNFAIFIFYKKENREIIKILNNFLIKGNDFINDSNLDFNKSRDDFIFELNVNPSPVLCFTINKFIIIDNNFEEEDLLSSKFLIIDLIGRRSGGKGG
jgi:hypothetical protein